MHAKLDLQTFYEDQWKPTLGNAEIYGNELVLSNVIYQDFDSDDNWFEEECEGMSFAIDKIDVQYNNQSKTFENLLIHIDSARIFDMTSTAFDFIYQIDDPNSIILHTGGYLNDSNTDIIATHMTKFNVKPSNDYLQLLSEMIKFQLIYKYKQIPKEFYDDIQFDESQLLKFAPRLIEDYRQFLQINLTMLSYSQIQIGQTLKIKQ